MTPQELKNSILQLAVQGKLVNQSKNDISVNFARIKQKETDKFQFVLPNNWRLAHLEAITNKTSSKQYQILESQVLKVGQFPVISQSKAYSIGFTNESEKVFHHNKPIIVFGDHTTEVKIVKCDFSVGADGVKIFEPIYDIISAEFLLYVLRYYSKDLSKIRRYSRHYKFIKDKPIPIPPLAEQDRIVAKIEELLPYIDRYEQAWTRLEELNKRFPSDLQKSILQWAIQGKLVEQREEEGTAEELYRRIQEEKERLVKEGTIKKAKSLPEITEDEVPFEVPGNWKWVRFSDLMDTMSTGPFGSILHKSDYIQNGIPLINPASIVHGKIIVAPEMTISVETAKRLEMYTLHQGMIVIGRRGEMGRCAVVTAHEDGWLCGTGSFFMKPNPGLYAYYISMFFSAPYAKAYLSGKSVGTTMSNLNHRILRKMPFSLPPLAEQKRIVSKLEELLPLCERLK